MSGYLVPGYITNADLHRNEIQYKWDEWNLEETVGTFDDDVYDELKQLSLRGAFAALVGAAEWVVYRLESLLDDDTLPRQALEAGWAQVVDPNYGIPWNPFEEWGGPVSGPIKRVYMLMVDASDYLKQGAEVARPAAKVFKVASHVVPLQAGYKNWEQISLQRLREHFPAMVDDPLGDPVPQQALDPDVNFDVTQIEELINAYLAQLDFNENAFLSTPDQMLEWGFQGAPYSFDLAQDRNRRKNR